MGGKNPKAKIVAILCPPCHDRVDNGTDWGNALEQYADGREFFLLFDLHGKTLIERPVLSAAAEGDPASLGEEQAKVATSAAAPSAGPSLSQEESDGRNADEEHNQGLSNGQGKGSAVQAMADTADVPANHHSVSDTEHHPSSLTHEQRVAIAQEIKDAEWGRQWIAGDVGNQWIAELGEEAEQYLSDFGYQPESLANILRVCAAIKPPYRNGKLRYSHHVVVYQENREDMEMWLDKCEEEQWSVAEFRRQVKGTKAKVKRWTLEELHVLRGQFQNETALGDGEAYLAEWFLDWLGEQG
jgi:hypothetical protein